MTEMGDDWRDYRETQKERRAERLPYRTQLLLKLREEGFIVEEKTAFHFRINNSLDVWPIHNRWHDLANNKRGGAKDLVMFVKEFFAK